MNHIRSTPVRLLAARNCAAAEARLVTRQRAVEKIWHIHDSQGQILALTVFICVYLALTVLRQHGEGGHEAPCGEEESGCGRNVGHAAEHVLLRTKREHLKRS